MNIAGLDKAAVLAALYNASKPQGADFIHYDPAPMSAEEAAKYLADRTYFDYLNVRVMKIDLENDEVDTYGYNRDNGAGAAEKVVDVLRATGDTFAEQIETHHMQQTHNSAVNTLANLSNQTPANKRVGDTLVVHLPTHDLADPIKKGIDKVLKATPEDEL